MSRIIIPDMYTALGTELNRAHETALMAIIAEEKKLSEAVGTFVDTELIASLALSRIGLQLLLPEIEGCVEAFDNESNLEPVTLIHPDIIPAGGLDRYDAAA